MIQSIYVQHSGSHCFRHSDVLVLQMVWSVQINPRKCEINAEITRKLQNWGDICIAHAHKVQQDNATGRATVHYCSSLTTTIKFTLMQLLQNNMYDFLLFTILVMDEFVSVTWGHKQQRRHLHTSL